MDKLKSKWNLVAIILGVGVSLAAFGVVLAAIVQVSQEIPSTLHM